MSGGNGGAMVPDGAPSSAAGNAAAAQLVVYGAPLAADPAELRDLAAAVDSGAALLGRGRALLQRAQAILHETAGLDAASAGPALARCWDALQAVGGVAEEAGAIAAALRRAAADYENAEAQAQAGFTRGLLVPAPPGIALPWDPLGPLGPLGPLAMLGAAFGGALARGQYTPTDAQFGAYLETWSGTVLSALGVSRVSGEPASSPVELAGLIAPLATLALGIGATARVHQIDPPGVLPTGAPATRTGPAVTDVADAVGALHALYPRYGGPEATVRIDRVVGPDGSVSWQVFVPGTQTELVPELAVPQPAGSPGATGPGWVAPTPMPGWVLPQPDNPVNNHGNPFDWGTNLQLFAGMDNAVEDGVVQAMEQAGIQPGEPVLLVGHSQGAMTTMRLAEDPEVTERFDIRSVITVGGPVGHIPTPDGVAVLNIEHVDDLTPGLENTANPVEPGRTTVIRDLAASPDPLDQEVTSAVQSHDIPAYVRTASMIDASTDPAVQAWFAASGDVLGGPTDTASSRYYQIERE